MNILDVQSEEDYLAFILAGQPLCNMDELAHILYIMWELGHAVYVDSPFTKIHSKGDRCRITFEFTQEILYRVDSDILILSGKQGAVYYKDSPQFKAMLLTMNEQE